MSSHDISVIAKFGMDGNILPLSLELDDGRRFSIDRILDIRPAASRKHGGLGIRYLCRVCGRELVLFLDENHWFYE